MSGASVSFRISRMMTMARSGPRPQFIPTTSAPAASRVRATSAGLSPPVPQAVFVRREGGSAERVRLDDVTAGREVPAGVAARDVAVIVVPELGARAVQEARREQLGAVAAVEDEDLAAAHALEDLP